MNPNVRCFLRVLFILFFSTGFSLSNETKIDNCIKCHQSTDFMVTNKKLYDYFQTWRASIHGQEEVTCVDCHGGNPEAEGKKESHADSMAASNIDSMVNFKNIPETCGECHNDLLNAYMKSGHYSRLTEQKQEQLGPNCVTCHGSLNSKKLNVNTVRAVCEKCHNKKSQNNPSIPSEAEALLNDFNVIRGYSRYIQKRAGTELAQKVRLEFNPKKAELAELWHSFELKKIKKSTVELLIYAKEKRNLLKKKKKSKSP